MINYIRHDEEFHSSIKLVSGEEIICKCIVTEDDGISIVYIQDPVCVLMTRKDLGNGKIAQSIGFEKWMRFSDEDFYIIPESSIISIAPISKQMQMYYTMHINQDKDIDSQTLSNKYKINPNEEMGLLGNIKDTRKRLEKIFKEL